MTRITTLSILALLVLAAGPAQAASPQARAAANCKGAKVTGLKLSESQGKVTLKVKAKGVSCRKAKSYGRIWGPCALHEGGRGGCGGFKRYKCDIPKIKTRGGTGPLEKRSVRQSCKQGRKRVTFSYTQTHTNPDYKPDYKTCSVDPSLNVNGTTVSSLAAAVIPCPEATEVARAFNQCRLAKGKAGRCVVKVKGFSCRESRFNAGGSFNSTAFCQDGAEILRMEYSQSLS